MTSFLAKMQLMDLNWGIYKFASMRILRSVWYSEARCWKVYDRLFPIFTKLRRLYCLNLPQRGPESFSSQAVHPGTPTRCHKALSNISKFWWQAVLTGISRLLGASGMKIFALIGNPSSLRWVSSCDTEGQDLLTRLKLDMEMSFTNAEGVMKRMESFIVDMWKLRQKLWAETGGEIPSTPFIRMSYKDAMRYHGVDKPDLHIKDLVSPPTLWNCYC